MSFAVDEIVRLDFRQNLLSQQVVNTFWYRCVQSTAATASAVGQAWWDNQKVAWRTYQVASANHLNLEVGVAGMNVGGDLGQYVIPGAEQQGLRAGGGSEFAPSFTAATIRLTVATRLTRPGSKRVGGLIETDVQQNLLLPATVTLIVAVGAAWNTSFVAGAPAVTFTPVVVKRKNPMVPPFVYQGTSSIAVNSTVRSQVSRRLGNGR